MSWPSTETLPALGIDDAADDADQRGLAGAIGAQQRKDLATADVKVDAFQRLEAGAIGLGEVCDGDDGGHVGLDCNGGRHKAADRPARGEHRQIGTRAPPCKRPPGRRAQRQSTSGGKSSYLKYAASRRRSDGEPALPPRFASITRRQTSTVAASPRSLAASSTIHAVSSDLSRAGPPQMTPKRSGANGMTFIADSSQPGSIGRLTAASTWSGVRDRKPRSRRSCGTGRIREHSARSRP